MTNTEDAEHIVKQLKQRNLTLATAESLTAGMLSSTIADISGASAVLQGGVIAYSNTVKHQLLGVSADTLTVKGAVEADTAKQMAQGAREQLGTDIGVATTGVAGPEPSEGKAVGTVFIALASADETAAKLLRLEGDRTTIRKLTVAASLKLMAEWLEQHS